MIVDKFKQILMNANLMNIRIVENVFRFQDALIKTVHALAYYSYLLSDSW